MYLDMFGVLLSVVLSFVKWPAFPRTLLAVGSMATRTENRVTWSVRDALPVALRRYVASPQYAAQLYGERESTGLNLSTLRIIWPLLLSSEANASLLGGMFKLCTSLGWGRHLRKRLGESSHWQTSRFVFYERALVNRAALWLHQPTNLPLHHQPMISSSELSPSGGDFVEVSHCFYRNRQEHITLASPMWFFHAPGSGIWLPLGKRVYIVNTNVIGSRRAALLHRTLVTGFYEVPPGSTTFTHRFAMFAANLSLMNYSEAAALDTVVFPLHSLQNWGGERLTELVSFRVAGGRGREIDYVEKVAALRSKSWNKRSYLSCGRPPRLRRCRAEEPAMRVHGTMCTQPLQRHMAELVTAARNCTDWSHN